MSFLNNRSLILALTARDIRGRYEGSALGLLWALLNPVLMMVVYTFVFGVVFKAKWSAGGESRSEFALILFSGLIVFNCFADCLNRAPTLIVSNPNYVKKVVFPLEILPWVTVFSALFHAFASLIVWLLFYIVLIGAPSVYTLQLPFVILPVVLLALGFGWFFASLGVYLRDVGQFVGIFTTVILFLSPVFYPVSSLPNQYRPLFYMNPLTPIIEMSRDALFWSKAIDPVDFGFSCLTAFSIAWFGFAWFQWTRRGFADVI